MHSSATSLALVCSVLLNGLFQQSEAFSRASPLLPTRHRRVFMDHFRLTSTRTRPTFATRAVAASFDDADACDKEEAMMERILRSIEKVHANPDECVKLAPLVI